MARVQEKVFNRAAEIVDYLLEDDKRTIKDAAVEFGVAKSTVERDITIFATEAFMGHRSNEKDLKRKYIKVKKHLNANIGRK